MDSKKQNEQIVHRIPPVTALGSATVYSCKAYYVVAFWDL